MHFGFYRKEEDKIINLLCKYPTLYDTSVENYKNNLITDNIWKDIGRELKKNTTTTGQAYHIYLSYFSNILNIIIFFENKLRTDSAAPKNSKNKTYDQLKFLENVPQHRSGGSNIPLSETRYKLDIIEDTSQDIQVAKECTEEPDNKKLKKVPERTMRKKETLRKIEQTKVWLVSDD
ncbi:uncharacterized protein LOC132702368 [Cylas formicarius]|uniref:uncharacterized protein LOC132702368 n=1 Tax=Cylas formicarius TaxID=197179 RepID=UPI0029583FC0|nr:uncharacterized protein LOC132702368 [Cylas formicarius]